MDHVSLFHVSLFHVSTFNKYLLYRELEKVQEAEMDRFVSYLHPDTSEQPLMHCLRETILRRHYETLLDRDTGLIRMLEEPVSSGNKKGNTSQF